MEQASANRLGIELLSFFGLPPLEQIATAARLGCSAISCGLTQLPDAFNPLAFPSWSLHDDATLRREVKAALRDQGIAISLGEGFSVRADASIMQRAQDADLMAELGASCLGGVCTESDPSRAIDEFSALAFLAAQREMQATIEFAPDLAVATLDDALSIVHAVGLPNFRLLIDAMHFFRSGGTVERLEALDPALIGYVQICDAPIRPAVPSYMDEAMTRRLDPGEGELPLAAFVSALPDDVPIGLEIPNLAKLRSVPDPIERLRPAVLAVQEMLRQRSMK